MTEMVLVPREPAEEMLDALFVGYCGSEGSFREAYRAMIAAAPSSPVGEGVREKVASRIRRLVGLADADFSFDAREAYVAKETDAILALLSTGEAKE